MSKQDNRRLSDKPVHVVAHSLFFYWWPVWLLSALLALMTYVSGVSFKTELADQSAVILRSAAPGTLFTLLLGVIILINTARIRRIVLLIGLPCLFAVSGLGLWFDWFDSLNRMIPAFDVRMTAGFYALLAILIGTVWAVTFLILDRLTFWRVKDDRLEQVMRLKGPIRHYPLDSLTLLKSSDDLPRHLFFGFGSGDLIFESRTDAHPRIEIRNVLGIAEKRKAIEQLLDQQGNQPIPALTEE